MSHCVQNVSLPLETFLTVNKNSNNAPLCSKLLVYLETFLTVNNNSTNTLPGNLSH